jgi:hypothetical protein
VTKSAEEASRVFATIFADVTFRLALLSANNEQQFVNIIANRAHKLTENSNYNFVKHDDFLQRLEPRLSLTVRHLCVIFIAISIQ